jgi:membrane protease YdiL (CAAX protease family)
MNRRIAGPLALFIVASTMASPLLSWIQNQVRLDPDVLRLTVFSTAIGAVLVWAVWRRGLPLPPPTRFGLAGPLLLSIGACLLIGAIMLGLARAEHAPWRVVDVGRLGAPLAVVLIVQLFGAAAEEVGWRGIVQPLFEARLPVWAAGLVTGLLFALGHFYIVFSVSPVSSALFVFSAVAMSMMLASLTFERPVTSRIVIATVFHYLLNMTTFALFTDGDGTSLYFLDNAMAIGLFGLIALAYLARRPR